MSQQLKKLICAAEVALEGFTDLFPEQCNEPCDFTETEQFCSRECDEFGCIKYKADLLRSALEEINPHRRDGV